MAAPLRFGFIMPAELGRGKPPAAFVDDPDRIVGQFESAWTIDHLQFGDMNLLEGLTSMSYLSALHPQLKFGNTVICQSFRNPALLAKMAATLQYLSRGRFILGLGAGWHEEEHRAYVGGGLALSKKSNALDCAYPQAGTFTPGSTVL